MQTNRIKIKGKRYDFSQIVAYEPSGDKCLVLHLVGHFDDEGETPYHSIKFESKNKRDLVLEKLDGIFKPIDLA